MGGKVVPTLKYTCVSRFNTKKEEKEYLQSDCRCYLLYVGSLCHMFNYGPADVGVCVCPVRFWYVDVCIMISLA